jgi:hypothetical protein
MFESKKSQKSQLWTPVELKSKRLCLWFDATDNTTLGCDKNNSIFILKDKSGSNQHFLQKVFSFFKKAVINLITIFKSL